MNRVSLTIIIIGVASVIAGGMAMAQEDVKPAPSKPYLAPVPDYGHWTVTLKYDQPASDHADHTAKPPPPPDGYPATIDTIKTGDLRGIVITLGDGTTRQFSCQGDWILDSSSKGAQLSIATAKQQPYVFYTKAFVLLDGVTIDPSTFKETAKHNGKFAFHYTSGDTDVWIDVKSMLPVTVKKQGTEADYQFLPAPPHPFAIPKDQAALLQKEQAAFDKTRSMR